MFECYKCHKKHCLIQNKGLVLKSIFFIIQSFASKPNQTPIKPLQTKCDFLKQNYDTPFNDIIKIKGFHCCVLDLPTFLKYRAEQCIRIDLMPP